MATDEGQGCHKGSTRSRIAHAALQCLAQHENDTLGLDDGGMSLKWGGGGGYRG